MIIHGARLSPFVRKVIVFAAEKGIDAQVQMAGFGQGGEGYLKGSPFGKIPALEDGDFLLCDSSAIVTYMDAVRPGTEMIPTEPRAKARTIWYEEFGDTNVMAAGREIFFNRFVAPLRKLTPDLDAANRAEVEMVPPIMKYIEDVLPDSGWLVEDRFTLADLSVACPLINLSYCSDVLDAERWPRAMAWLAQVKARPSMVDAMAHETQMLEQVRAQI